MKTKLSPSLYRYWKSLRSTVSVSIFAPALKVRSTVFPVRTFFTLVRTNAPPLPGLTCWNSMTVQSPPSMLRTTPFLMSAVEAMRKSIRSLGMSCGECAEGKVYRLGTPAPNKVECEQVRVEAETGDDPGGDSRDDAGVAKLFAGVRIRDVHFHQQQPRLGDEGYRVPKRIGVVREGGRIEDHRGARIDSFMQPADQLRFVVGLAQVDLRVSAGHGGAQVVQCGGAIDIRFPGSQAVEVRAVQHQHAGHVASLGARRRSPGTRRRAGSGLAPQARSASPGRRGR